MSYDFFWVIPRRLSFICRRFWTLCSIFIGSYLPMKMEQCSETSAHKIQKRAYNKISIILHEYLNTFHCCRRHKFAIRALLCNNQYFQFADNDMRLSNTQRRICCVFTVTMATMRTCHNVTWQTYTAQLVKNSLFLYILWTSLTHILLTWRIWWAPNNASQWEMGFNPYPANVENMVSS